MSVKSAINETERSERAVQKLLRWQARDAAYRSLNIAYGTEDHPIHGGPCWCVILRSRRRNADIRGYSSVFWIAATSALESDKAMFGTSGGEKS